MSTRIYEALQTEAMRLGYRPIGEPAFGWNEKSVGSEVIDSKGNTFWAKMFSAPAGRAKGREWEGEKLAAHWVHAWKPRVRCLHEFGEEERTQFIVSDKIKGHILGEHPHHLRDNAYVSDEYLLQLREALKSLKCISTDRVNTRFDLVRRRVFERWELNIKYLDCSWETIHGDLHWQNLSGPSLEIVDWEGWGIGLQHQDLAFLIAFSSLNDDLVRRIRTTFRGSTVGHSLALAELFVTAELLRMAENYGDHPELVPGLKSIGERARNEWVG